MNKWVALPGVGNGDGSDLSMEIRLDGLLIYECKFGDNINCQVSKLYYRKKESPDQAQYVHIMIQTEPVLIKFGIFEVMSINMHDV